MKSLLSEKVIQGSGHDVQGQSHMSRSVFEVKLNFNINVTGQGQRSSSKVAGLKISDQG